MRVEPIEQATVRPQAAARLPGEAVDRSGEDRPSGRALVVTGQRSAAGRVARPYQSAFLAHLIATKAQAPQTRERRRTEPTEAIAAYRATAAITG